MGFCDRRGEGGRGATMEGEHGKENAQKPPERDGEDEERRRSG